MSDAIRTLAHLHAALLLALLGTAPATAQQRPLTGQMLGEQPTPTTPPARPAPVAAPVAAAPAPVALALPPRPQLGDTTRALLQLQASGEHAGKPHTVLGDQASRSYARYLNSFDHPIPEYLEQSVRRDVASEGGE
ncbi:DUF3613 domain-containing protein [Stenotrophomonas sp. 278]|uniref:DUF3613 domain-containing protein n=1 Tax=Stenotrophomonas sp. 278 TaxID=2479851 RepID=UPI000F67568B|nr:DUF3613 domain-containing protein [Stenotrophomonas sp. 278]RRU09444.1 DUF3613 domain-containing protein [Stenotrophomonas sp. 278]